jgi:hypothetical protein
VLKYTLLSEFGSKLFNINRAKLTERLESKLVNIGTTFDYEWHNGILTISYDGDRFSVFDLGKPRYRIGRNGLETIMRGVDYGVIDYNYRSGRNVYDIKHILSYSQTFYYRKRVVSGNPRREAIKLAIEISEEISDTYEQEFWFFVLLEIISNAMYYNNTGLAKISLYNYLKLVFRR